MVTPAHPLLSVIVPVYNGTKVLPRALAALAASDLTRECWELILVDDASTDDSAALAAQWADVIVRLPGRPHGPAYARNRGAEAARGAVLVFVDADVCVHADTLRRFASTFADHPELASVFGSYDDRPPGQGLPSRYRNLLHHYHHQLNPGPAETFWAGCGAIRADAFHAVGTFDEWRYPRPSIEDIELGHRLHAAEFAIQLDPAIQCTHLKRWGLYGMLRTDLLDRGVPWMRLMLTEGSFSKRKSLNLKPREKVFTALAGLSVLCLLAAILRLDARWLIPGGLLLLPVGLGNLALYRFLAKQGGVLFALGCFHLHILYYLLNGAAVSLGVFLHHIVGEPAPRPEVQALSEVGLDKWPPVPRRMGAAQPAAPRL